MKIFTQNSTKQSLKNVKVGENVIFFDFVNAYNCEIDSNTKIGAFVEIQKNAFIGKNCKISSHTFICEGVTIEDEVFIGHNVSFINDIFPKAVNDDGTIQTEKDWKLKNTLVKKRSKYWDKCYNIRWNNYRRKFFGWCGFCGNKRCTSQCYSSWKPC